MAAAAEPDWAARLRGLLDPATADESLAAIAPWDGFFRPLLRHTATPTIVQAGDKFNVVPALAELTLDGRALPGASDEALIADVLRVVGDDVGIEVLRSETGRDTPDLALYDLLADVLREADPDGVPVPLVMPGATDARILDALGIQSYGFLPLRLPDEFVFFPHIHAADERVPVAALDFGAAAIGEVLRRYPGNVQASR
jgi:acetylornithine deacetylase/succinyl-diaminopimelate desuccinylase-like protein